MPHTQTLVSRRHAQYAAPPQLHVHRCFRLPVVQGITQRGGGRRRRICTQNMSTQVGLPSPRPSDYGESKWLRHRRPTRQRPLPTTTDDARIETTPVGEHRWGWLGDSCLTRAYSAGAWHDDRDHHQDLELIATPATHRTSKRLCNQVLSPCGY